MSVIYEYLENVCEILDSYRIPITAKDRKNGKYPYYGANGLQDYVDDYIFDDELVLLAEDGGNFGSKERPIAYRVSGKCWVNNHAHVLKAKACIDINYLCYSLMFYNTDGIVNGATRKKLTQSAMRQMRIPLRNMAEQQKIVVRIDKVIQVIERHHNEIRMLDELVQSRFVEMFGDPVTNPLGWKETTVGDECYYIKDGPHKSLNDIGKENGGHPFISARNIVNGYIDFSTAKYISDEDYQNAINKCHPEKGDILYSKGGTTGIAKLIDVDIEFANWVHVAVLKFDRSTLHGVFFENMLNCDYCYEQSQRLTKGIANRDLVLSAMAKIKMYRPPIELQIEFAAFIKQVDKSKLTVQKSLEKLEILKKSLMQQYFGQEGTEKWRK